MRGGPRFLIRSSVPEEVSVTIWKGPTPALFVADRETINRKEPTVSKTNETREEHKLNTKDKLVNLTTPGASHEKKMSEGRNRIDNAGR